MRNASYARICTTSYSLILFISANHLRSSANGASASRNADEGGEEGGEEDEEEEGEEQEEEEAREAEELNIKINSGGNSFCSVQHILFEG